METSQTMQNANQVTDSSTAIGFAERNFETNILNILWKNLCSCDYK